MSHFRNTRLQFGGLLMIPFSASFITVTHLRNSSWDVGRGGAVGRAGIAEGGV